MRLGRLIAGIGACLASAGAFGAEFWVEGPANAAKSDASAQEDAGRKAGVDARVVRRYVEDQGWRYVVVSDALDAEAAARTTAASLAGAITRPVTVFTREGKETRQIAVVDAGAPPPPPATEQDPEVARILAQAVVAHGGAAGGLAVVEHASTVRFEYERELEDGLKVRHTWLRRGSDRSLSVKILAGSGIDSETRLVGGSAWLQTGKDPFSAQDAARAAELLEQASPSGIIPFVLVFPAAAGSRSEFARLERGEPAAIDGRPCTALRFEGDRASGPMTLDIDTQSGFVRRVSFEDGDLVHQFDDYAEVAPGLVAPKRIRTWREGKLVETTTVSALVLGADLPAGALAAPAP
jgi:hypothetical protein